MASRAVELKNVGFETGGLWLLRGVSAEVDVGQTVAIIGPSGAGKSTLISLINLMRTPTEGEIWVLGQEVRAWPVRELRQRVGMVFQSPVIFPGSVRDNVLFGLELHRRPPRDVAELLQMVDLPAHLADHAAEDLSGGQKSRVALARTLAMEPDILLLDEVTAALDVHAKREVESTLLRLKREFGKTMLWVTHDLDQARRVADEVWFVAGGRLVERGTPDEIFNEPRSEALRSFLAEGGEVRS
ncbi:amino acid ABC transporter ATP-binding protein [Alicyclobacillus sendaiensis]|uniref:ATP-binding cassette domain-containing protein n=1 Tax=Alicyclobacillus sendaiensis PA2 TaxID=3029425 RepID=A0ABT6XX06_ALISE|nr:ATP-binding cassette domain-containing protein [Alicyclobacillus sendaiensis]MDI9259625.1 ATP-binding cassette domain-containing protein [Alicyclobacillus sendaiensis PA2]